MTQYDHTIDLFEELDSLSKVHFLKRDEIDEIMIEFASRIVATLGIERLSVWLFDRDKTSLMSMGEYDARDRSFQKNSELRMEHYPAYFEALQKDKIIIATNIFKDERTKEFTERYSIPNNIITLMDIPLRMAGELIGVMCYEKTGDQEHEFSSKEVQFAFSVALVFASNLEARYRRAAQHNLEAALKEKELLISEMNHRVRNNFAILISLLKIRKMQVTSVEAERVIDEFEQRIYSIMSIHELLRDSGSHIDVNLGEYLAELVQEFKNAHDSISTSIRYTGTAYDCILGSKTIINIGLIVTEILLNSLKHVYPNTENYFLELNCTKEAKGVRIEIVDAGTGFAFEQLIRGDSLGLSLVRDLAEDIGLEATYPNENSSRYSFFLVEM